VPALARSNHLDCGVLHRKRFGASFAEVDPEAFGDRERAGLRQKHPGRIDPDHRAAPTGQPARNRPGTRADVDHHLAKPPDAQDGEALEEALGKPRAMERVVGCRSPEVDHRRAMGVMG